MAVDSRDQIWNATFETYYAIYFEEMVTDALVARWQYVDDIAKVLIAVTASGSAVAGWALWQMPDYRIMWSLLAGLGAFLSIVHSALGVQARLKDLNGNRGLFTGLRIDIETFRYRMQVDPDFSIDAFTRELIQLRKRYGGAIERIRGDILLTDGLRSATQTELDEKLGNLVVANQEEKK